MEEIELQFCLSVLSLLSGCVKVRNIEECKFWRRREISHVVGTADVLTHLAAIGTAWVDVDLIMLEGTG